MVTSTDGGLTWGSLHTVEWSSGLGGQPVALPNGTVVVPYTANYSAVYAAVSTDGGNSWSDHFAASQISAGRPGDARPADADRGGRLLGSCLRGLERLRLRVGLQRERHRHDELDGRRQLDTGRANPDRSH